MKKYLLRNLIFSFLLAIFSPVFGANPIPELPENASPRQRLEAATCATFLAQQSRFRKFRHSYGFNFPETRRAILGITGVSFDSREIPFAPEAPAEPQTNPDGSLKAPEDPLLKLVVSWFEEIEKYPAKMRIIARAIYRYAGDPSITSAQTENDWRRKKGRLNILYELRNQARADRLAPYDHSSASAAKDKFFPKVIWLPRAITRIGKEAQNDSGNSALPVKGTIGSLAELEEMIRFDERELAVHLNEAVQREILQAQVFLKLQMFRQGFADSEASVSGSIGAENTSENQIRGLIKKADFFLHSDAPDFAELRPSRRATEYVLGIIGSGTQSNLAQARYWEMQFRRYSHWISGWVKWFNKRTTELRQPGLLYTSVAAIGLSILGTWATVRYQVGKIHDQIVKDEAALRQQAFVQAAQDLRKSVGVKAVNHWDFYNGLLQFGQDGYSDESVTIAFEFLLGIRSAPEVDPKRDTKIEPSRYASIGESARDIVTRINIQRFSLVDEKGNVLVSGTEDRIPRRQWNQMLAAELARQETERTSEQFGGLQNLLKNPVPRDPNAPKDGPVVVPNFKTKK